MRLCYVNIVYKESFFIHIYWSNGVSLSAQVVEHLSGRPLLYDLNKLHQIQLIFLAAHSQNVFLFFNLPLNQVIITHLYRSFSEC